MTITRDGKEITLTKQELFEAYEEQEHIYDMDLVKSRMDEHLEPEQYEILKDNEDFISETAHEIRRSVNKYGASPEYELEDAIGMLAPEYLEKLQ